MSGCFRFDQSTQARRDQPEGLTFSLGSRKGTAFAVISLMGALGVTANELFMYPYWVLEKGYAGHVGPPESAGWQERARGWIRVLRLDAACATLLATVIAAAYFLIAGAVLHRVGKVPSGIEVVKEISAIYTETYGPWSYWLFMFGGFCTLFSTLVVVVAATGRMWTDLLSSMGVFDWNDQTARRRCNRIFQNLYLVAFLAIALFVTTPADFLVRLGQYINGLINTPIIMFGIGWVAFHTDRRLRMSRLPAVMLLGTMAVIIFCIAYGLFGEPGSRAGEGTQARRASEVIQARSASEGIQRLRHQLLNPLQVRADRMGVEQASPLAVKRTSEDACSTLVRFGETPETAPLKPAIWKPLREVRTAAARCTNSWSRRAAAAWKRESASAC